MFRSTIDFRCVGVLVGCDLRFWQLLDESISHMTEANTRCTRRHNERAAAQL